MTLESRLFQIVKGWSGKSGSAKRPAHIAVWGQAKSAATPPKALGPGIPIWSWKEVQNSNKHVAGFQGRGGPSWWVRPLLCGQEMNGEGSLGYLSYNEFAQGRDSVGQAVVLAFEAKVDSVTIDFLNCSDELIFGALVGIDLAAYDFRRVEDDKFPPKVGLKLLINGKPMGKGDRAAASELSSAVNLARHLTNSPPNILNPVSFSQAIKALFQEQCAVTVWGPEQLKKEKCNLLLAVGAASETPPQLVQIKYRPKGGGRERPLAFVGKGITFDTGGLDLKPDTAMRLMKKDMGGAAAVVGLAWWVVQSQFERPCDFYLALAENSVGGSAFRPGDVIRARSGISVEIHNTDAEGRLVLADALDVAVENKPEMIIDVATLTGAIKAALGSQVAGLFGNRDDLVSDIASGCSRMGDCVWPMPLYRKYKTALKSNAAEMVNAGDGFGGAITAALFLENFVGKVPWAHLDIYAWKDAADGALGAPGASGQAVQGLAGWLKGARP